MKPLFLYLVLFYICLSPAFAQHLVRGHVFCAQTKEPMVGVNVVIPGTNVGTTTDQAGTFALALAGHTDSLSVSYLGYQSTRVCCRNRQDLKVALQPSAVGLQPMVVTASRDVQPRSETPVAISLLSSRQMEETKPTVLAEALNKVPGVLMVNLGNEQHSMAIRQPMSLRGYFLYLEDGIPIRPAGLFNHNALIEVNMFGLRSVEVIKGPASSLYGSEAIGGAVNFITQAPSAVPTVRVGLHADQWGYRRTQFQASNMVSKKLGVYLGGYYARQRNGWQGNSDFDKLSLNLRTDYFLNDKTKVVASLTTNHLDTQTGGSLDSLGFYERRHTTLHTFTDRTVAATRARVTLQKFWSGTEESQVTVFFRDNRIGQIPAYAVRNVRGNPSLAHGEQNEASFRSYGFSAQHHQGLAHLPVKFIAGVLADYTPSGYRAHYLAVDRDPTSGRYLGYTARPDSLLTHYQANLFNSAAYLQTDIAPTEKLKLVAGLRYDRLDYRYDNHLLPSAFSGAPDERNAFSFFTPKLGVTYELAPNRGLYANASAGAYAPGIGELYRGVKVPTLRPARFRNYEAGGWVSLLHRRLHLEATLYQMDGTDEIVSYLLPDNSTENRNSGQTLHRGVEYSLLYTPSPAWTFRFGGTNALHEFVTYTTQEGTAYDGNRMPNAPAWVANGEVTLKPTQVPGLRVSLEWQRISSWYKDDANRFRYDDRTLLGLRGVSVLHLRAGYTYKTFEVYTNVLNLTNELYAHNATRGRWGDTFNPAAGRTVALGLSYSFTGKSDR